MAAFDHLRRTRLAAQRDVALARHRHVVLPIAHNNRFRKFLDEIDLSIGTRSIVEAFERKLKDCRA